MFPTSFQEMLWTWAKFRQSNCRTLNIIHHSSVLLFFCINNLFPRKNKSQVHTTKNLRHHVWDHSWSYNMIRQSWDDYDFLVFFHRAILGLVDDIFKYSFQKTILKQLFLGRKFYLGTQLWKTIFSAYSP